MSSWVASVHIQRAMCARCLFQGRVAHRWRSGTGPLSPSTILLPVIPPTMVNPPAMKKQKITPSALPRTPHGNAAASSERSYSRSMSREHAATPRRATKPHAAMIYPTPTSDKRTLAVDLAPPHTPLHAPNFEDVDDQADSMPTPGSENLDGEQDAHLVSELHDRSDSDEPPSPHALVTAVDLAANNSPPRRGKAVERLSDAELEAQMAQYQAELDKRRQGARATPGRSSTPGPSAISVPGRIKGQRVMVKVEDGVVAIQEETLEEKAAREMLDQVVGQYARDVILQLCGLKHANDVNVELLYNDNQDPVYWDSKGQLRPHYNLSLDVNLKAWGERFDKTVTDVSRMPKEHQEYLKTLTTSRFRQSLGVTFQGMQSTYKSHVKNGSSATKKEKDAARSRRSNRKKEKAASRGAMLENSGVSVDEVAFLVHPGYQSSECSDAEDMSHRVVDVPQHRAEIVSKILGALDKKYQKTKSSRGSQTVKKRSYIMVNIEVPALGSSKNFDATTVPRWAVNDQWVEAHPELASESWPKVDRSQKTMPYPRELGLLTNNYPLDPRVFVYDRPESKSLSLVGARAPVLAPGSGPVLSPDPIPTPNAKPQSVVENPPMYNQVAVPMPHPVQNNHDTANHTPFQAPLPLPGSTYAPAPPYLVPAPSNPTNLPAAYAQPGLYAPRTTRPHPYAAYGHSVSGPGVYDYVQDSVIDPNMQSVPPDQYYPPQMPPPPLPCNQPNPLHDAEVIQGEPSGRVSEQNIAQVRIKPKRSSRSQKSDKNGEMSTKKRESKRGSKRGNQAEEVCVEAGGETPVAGPSLAPVEVGKITIKVRPSRKK
ncbi:hypothetical protein RhiJN_13823 [Ceratobasidium sp. AG-Ba]|nr:hypothetical protein RhiJN_13823 [Ceratobasidium sp. AG-Ba]QRW14382.1 hypothetical protein RhiLY_13381 [Ceratobasidium sp. AG-Ba]